MAQVDNIIFGKEIKGLNLLNNINHNYSIWHADKILGNVENLFLRELVKENIVKYGNVLKTNIRFITKPVYEAWQKNEGKIVEFIGKRSEQGIKYGIHIYKDAGITTVSYFFMNLSNDEYFLLNFTNNSLTFANFIATNEEGKKVIRTYNPLLDSEELAKMMKRPPNTNDIMDIQLEIDYLITHMTIEPKFLGPRAKLHEQNCKYENHTNHSIEIIKSNYLYDLQKSGAFKVSGHFRWQPYKDGEKRLIFISDFVKTGYTTKLRKE